MSKIFFQVPEGSWQKVASKHFPLTGQAVGVVEEWIDCIDADIAVYESGEWAAYKRFVLKATGPMKPPAKNGDVGFNLPASEPLTIEPYSFAKVPTGIKIELPENHWAMIAPRSSTNIGGSLIALVGIIDNGYRGELFVFVHNLSPNTVHVGKNQSLAQIVIMPMAVPEVVIVDNLSESERGESGFGSSGK